MAGARSKRGTAPGAAAPSRTPAKNRKTAPLPFNHKLVLHQWLLGLFGVEKAFDEDRVTYIDTLLRRAVGSAT